MKALNPFKNYLLFSFCLVILTATGCKKSSETTNPNDLGYGCNTSVIQETLTNKTATVVYSQSQSQWFVFINNTTYGYSVIPCANSAVLKAITDKHALTDVFTISVSGNVKYQYANQLPLNQNTSYVDVYLIDITNIAE